MRVQHILILIVCFFIVGCNQKNEKLVIPKENITPSINSISNNDFIPAINGISIDTEYSTVLKKFGNPKKIIKHGPDNLMANSSILEYDGLMVYFAILGEDGVERVVEVNCLNNIYKTDKGIRVGDTERQLLDKYGASKEAAFVDNQGNTIISYGDNKGYSWINFYLIDGKITKISLSSEYT